MNTKIVMVIDRENVDLLLQAIKMLYMTELEGEELETLARMSEYLESRANLFDKDKAEALALGLGDIDEDQIPF
jgi:hypothetical protein